MTWRSQVAPVLSTICLAWCVLVGLLIWFTPMRYSGTSNGVPVVVSRAFSEVSGYGALPLVIPVLVAGLGAWRAWRGQRLVVGGSAVLLAVFTLISGFSIGEYYLPASGLQLLAAGWPRSWGVVGSNQKRLTIGCSRGDVLTLARQAARDVTASARRGQHEAPSTRHLAPHVAPGTRHRARSETAYCLPDVDVAGEVLPVFRYLSNHPTQRSSRSRW
jgi:hypothetical protein